MNTITTDRERIESITDRKERLLLVLDIVKNDLAETDFNELTTKELQAYENTLRKFLYKTKRQNKKSKDKKNYDECYYI